MTANSVNTYIVPTTANEVTMPSQPCFMAWLDAQVDNVTGDSTVYTITYDTEEFDQNNDFNGTTTFTAPVTGKYMFIHNFNLDFDGASPTQSRLKFVASNRTYRYLSSDEATEVQNVETYNANVTVDMDASDTLTVTTQYNGAGKVIDLVADVGGEPTNWLCGVLLL